MKVTNANIRSNKEYHSQGANERKRRWPSKKKKKNYIRRILHKVNNSLAVILGNASVGVLIATTPKCEECKKGYTDIAHSVRIIRKLLKEAYQLEDNNASNAAPYSLEERCGCEDVRVDKEE